MGIRRALLALAFGGSLFAGVLPPYSISNGAAAFTVDYNGIISTTSGTAVVPGLKAKIKYSNFVFTTVSGKTQVQFNYSVTNNSTVGSRVSAIGFATTPNINMAASSVTGPFTQVKGGNFPIPAVTSGLEFCFNNTSNNCAGNGGAGVTNPNTAGGVATLRFNSLFTTLTFDNFFVRYQSVCLTSACNGSAVGKPVATAPEPSLVVLLSAGVVGVLTTRRRRAVA